MAANSEDFLYKEVLSALAQQNGQQNPWDVIDNISRSMGGGSEYSRFGDFFYGLNRLPNLAPLPTHQELQGLVLFTRPNLNLSYDNISYMREMTHLLTQEPQSYQYAVRMMLDTTTHRATMNKSPLVDPYMPYMTLLSNSIVTMSPPPDMGLNMYSSPEGVMKEAWIMNDSIAEYHGRYDLTATFNNVKGGAVPMAFHAWLKYMGMIRIGPAVPHPESRRKDVMDYFTRIERLKLDASGRYVEQWFHTGASVPTNISIGAAFGFNREEGMEMENKQFSVQFASVGAVYNDPIQLMEFNLRMESFNKKMATRGLHYVKIPHGLNAATNYYGYPYINLATYELEWWIEKELLDKLTKGL